ncbi:MAG: rRNA pseudouridine synthase [Candidatus Omnitrophica bacterium]|nr:rRNA pseudouridine synthase [Candidatus Omnitrophota bacterium]
MRLQSFLSQAGISSRRSVIQELEDGKVKVNGEVVRIPSYPIFPGKDQVTYLDQEVTLYSRKTYFIFNKPRGVITTAKDTHGRKTVLDYFKNMKERLYPVGRLDQDTTGLLLLTNDGDLANKLMHPRFGVEKVYEALLDQEVSKEKISQLESGVVIEGIKTSPCKIKILSVRDGKSRVEIVLHEGRKRQIRNMFQAIGIKVVHLHRKRYGPLNLKGLTPGKSRLLTSEELTMLLKAVSQKPTRGGERERKDRFSVKGGNEPAHDASAREHRGHRLRRRDSFHRG